MHENIEAWRAGSASWVDDWDTKAEIARAAFAALVGLPPLNIALIPSVSVGVGLIASMLEENDVVVVPDDEFTSVLFPVLVAARQRGVTVHAVPLENLVDAISAQTTLVAFSLVQSHSGRTADQTAVIDVARSVGARTLVDATHAIPFVDVDTRADFIVCAAYKHLLSPRGVGFLAVAQEQWDRLTPWMANWRSSSSPYTVYYGGPLDLAPGAARFDVSLAWFAWAGAAVSLSLLSDWKRQGFLTEPVYLARRIASRLGFSEPVGTLVSLPVEDAEVVRVQLGAANVKGAVRKGSVRLSTHVYNTVEQVDAAVTALARLVPQTTP